MAENRFLKYVQQPSALAGDPVIAPPDPYKQSAEARAQAGQGFEAQRLEMEAERLRIAQQEASARAEKEQLDLDERRRRQQALDAGIEDSKFQLRNVIDAARQAQARSNDWFATGFGADTAKGFGGTSASDIAALLNTIGSNTAFDRLQKMRDESPTGGALGAVSEIELQLLRDSIASLDQTQSDSQFQANMGKVIESYQRVLDRLEGKEPEVVPSSDAPDGQTLLGFGRNDDGTSYPIYGYPTEPGGAASSPERPDYSVGGLLKGVAQGAGSVVEGAASLPGIIINPIGQMLYDALGYDQTYDTGTILREGIGLPDNPNRINDTIIQGAGAALTGSLGARAAQGIANSAVSRGALATVGRTPIRDTVAGAGAGAGALVGERSGVPGGEVIGALAGGLAGYAGASRVGALANVGGGPNALGQAALRQNVDLLPADAGGPIAKALTTGTKASPISVAPVVSQAQRQQAQMRSALRQTAEREGDVISTDRAGQGVRSAAERFTTQTSQRASRLYDRAGNAAKGVSIKPLKTTAKLDEYIARVKGDPSAPDSAVTELTRFRDNIAKGVGVTGLRDARSRLAQGVYDGKLRSGSEQAMWKDILGNLSEDIELGLKSAGRGDAADMFKRADQFWRDRVEHIDQVLQPILGRDRSGEQIVQAVESMTRGQAGGNARLSRLLGRMAPEEAGQLRAVVIDRLGRANPGAQDAEGTAFSASTFLTNWNKMTPQAKASLFGEKQLRADLDDIAKLAEGMKATQSMANFSNTAVASYSNVAAAVALGSVANPAVVALGAGAQYLTGRLMASPAFARLLARTSKMSNEAANRRFPEQLAILAAREPALAGDIKALQQHLQNSFEQSPGRLAAREEENE